MISKRINKNHIIIGNGLITISSPGQFLVKKPAVDITEIEEQDNKIIYRNYELNLSTGNFVSKENIIINEEI